MQGPRYWTWSGRKYRFHVVGLGVNIRNLGYAHAQEVCSALNLALALVPDATAASEAVPIRAVQDRSLIDGLMQLVHEASPVLTLP